MKGSILTFSQTGNTLKVGASIARGLKTFGAEVDQVSFLHRNRWKPDNADLIGIGCPVFENRPAEVVPEYLADGGLMRLGTLVLEMLNFLPDEIFTTVKHNAR
jgi:menaquinone-dependent protoporphyrinogen IX oxidase